MSDRRRIGLLGGTFDPVHFGHLDAADAARTRLALDEILLIPSHVPPHRQVQPRASSHERFALLALAVQDRPGYRVSDAELERQGPSFTVDTLRHLHADGWQPLQLFFILGADAFADIGMWREFPAVLDAAQFVVIARPGATLEHALARNPALRSRVKPADAAAADTGQTGIFLVEARTRDVSSTAIRDRIAAGQNIDDLVPAAVARYIAANDLYQTVNELHG